MKSKNLKIGLLKIENYESVSLRVLVSVIFILLASIVLLVKLSTKPNLLVQSAWFDDAYTYRQTITITHNANLFSNQAIGVSVSTSALVSAVKMQSDCDDTRFTDASGQVLIYQLVSGCNDTNTQYTVVVPKVASGTNYIYVYYGNPLATSNSQSTSAYTSLSPSTPGPAAASEEVGGGPIAYWKMDEGVGSTINDSSGQNIKGVLGTGSSAPTWQVDSNCKLGKCLYFDGVNSNYVGINGVYPYQTPTNQWSQSAWVYPESGGDADNVIFSQHNSIESGFYLNTSSHYLRSNWRTTGAGIGFTAGTVSNNTWSHVATIYDGTNVIHYINGIMVGSTNPGATLSFRNNDSNKVIGYNQLDGSSRFKGKIDDLKIYNYARTSAQVLADYNSRGTVHGSSANLGNLDVSGTGPVGYWNFEEGTGTTAYDSSTNSNPAELKNTPSWSTGKYGTAITLNGSNQYLEAAHSSSLNIAGNITLETWVKFNSIAGNSFIIEKNGDSSQKAYYLWWSNGGTLYTGYHDGTTFRDYTHTWTPTVGLWYHLAWTADGTNVNIYINGVMIKQTAQTGAVKSNSAGVLDFGHQTTGSGYLNGQMDEVKIYNYARTQKQIIQDLNGGHPAGGSPVGSQIGYWKFDEGVGSTAYNSGSAGSILNAKLSSGTSAPTWSVNGKYNKGLSFDGGDYLTIPDDPSLDLDQMTISTWVNISSSNTNNGIIYKGSLASSQGVYSLGFYTGANTKIVFRLNGSTSEGSGQLTSTTALSQNQWYHLVATYDRSTIKIYLNGNLDASNSYSTAVTADANPLYIGCYYSGSYCITSGVLDDIKLYNFALSASDVLIDYNRGQALVLGSSSSDLGGTSFSNSTSRSYCVPGDTSTCSVPVNEWLLEEGLGTTAYDTGSGPTNLVLNNSPSRLPGKFGNGLLFDGSSQSASGTITSLGNTNSISVWVYPTGSIASKTILTNLTTNGSSQPVYGTCTGTAISLNTWTLITAISNGASVCQIYQNGLLTSSNTTGVTYGTTVNLANSSFSGRLDQIRFYNYVRTPAQIAWEYNQGKPVVQYKLDECQGTTIYDSMGTGYTGTWSGSGGGSQTSTGSCTTNAATAWYNGRSGKINSSLNFDGTDDYINFGTTSRIHDSSEMTLSCWVKTSGSSAQVCGRTNDDISSGGYGLMFSSGLPYGVFFGSTSGSGENILGTRTINDGLWHLLTMTYQKSSNKLLLFVDGKLDGTSTTTSAGNVVDNDPTIPLTMGEIIMGGSPAGFPLSGQADDMRLYNYALTPAQVQMLYNSNTSVNFAPVTGAP